VKSSLEHPSEQRNEPADQAGCAGVPMTIDHASSADSPATRLGAISLQSATQAISEVTARLQAATSRGIALASEKPAEFLGWIADCATSGFPGFPSAAALAAEFQGTASDREAVDALVNDQIEFIRQKVSVNLAGAGSLYASMFADMASPWLLKMRLVFAVATVAGHDPRAPETRSLGLACLCGSEAGAVIGSARCASGTAFGADRAAIDRAICAAVSKRFAQRQTAKGAVRVGVQGVARMFRKVPFLDVIETVTDRIYEHVDVSHLIEVSEAAKRVFGRTPVP